MTTPFAERGAVTDEYIDAFRTLWTEASPRIDGKYVHVGGGMVFEPKPVQKPHPPIWVGGESGPSMRRAARVGDAWYPIGSNNSHLLDTLAATAGGDRADAQADRGGRPRSGADAGGVPGEALRFGGAAESVRRRAAAVLGRDADVLADLRSLREIGVTGLDFDFEWIESADAALAEMRRFREQVLARV